tara:strand:+ start:1107 stop:1535 length:429 start_codon:yes stop_codon:yes gene_type:complete
MPINRRSVTVLSATGTEMNKYSDDVKGDSYYGYTDGLHTIQVNYNNFVGRFHIQATLSLTPTEADYFDVIVDNSSGLHAGSTAWNPNGYVQFNADAPGNKSEAYTFRGNFTFIRAYMDRTYIGDGTTYDSSYGQISNIILSA